MVFFFDALSKGVIKTGQKHWPGSKRDLYNHDKKWSMK